MVGKGMRGWTQFDKGNGILCRRNSKYEFLRWKHLGIFLETQESTARQEEHREREEGIRGEGHRQGGGEQRGRRRY